MARVFSVNVSPGGVPTPSVPFGRAVALGDGRKAFVGYLWTADNSHFRKYAAEVEETELRELGLENLKILDWGGKRKRVLLKVINEREDRAGHNSQDKLVCLFALERLFELRSQGYPLFPGALGETITTEGLDNAALRTGFLLGVGEEGVRGMILRLTIPRKPCMTIEPYATVASLVPERAGKPKLQLVKAVGFTEDPEDPKFGGSGWYCAVENIWGSGVVMPLDQIRVMK